MYQDYRPNRFQALPTIIKNLLIINGIMFLATIALQSRVDLYQYLGLHYFRSEYFKPFQFFSYLFMHGNFMHLFFNMFAVWTFGAALENVWGPKRFLFYYLFTGLGAGLIQYLVFFLQIEPTLAQLTEEFNHAFSAEDQLEILNVRASYLNSHVVVGASGSLFGLLIAFGWLFPNAELIMLFFPIPIKAKYFVAIYGILELVSGISNNPEDNVAHFAHLGGMLFGFILLMIWRKDRRNFY